MHSHTAYNDQVIDWYIHFISPIHGSENTQTHTHTYTIHTCGNLWLGSLVVRALDLQYTILSASEVTTLWRYTNMFIITIINSCEFESLRCGNFI